MLAALLPIDKAGEELKSASKQVFKFSAADIF